jgi:hypothetical protein
VSGNRLTARLTQWPTAGQSSADNVRSQLNAYDALDRLVSTEVGTLEFDPSTGAPGIVPASRVRTDTWTLDLLGNWAGAPAPQGGVATPGREVTPGPLGADQALDAEGRTQARHWPDRRNRLLVTRLSGAGGENAATAVNRYDAAGNLVFDGEYFYQYDAWSRLLQVNRAHLDPVGPQTLVTDPEELIDLPPGGEIVPGVLVKHLTCNGLGRLAGSGPLPPSQSPPVEHGTGGSRTCQPGAGSSIAARSARADYPRQHPIPLILTCGVVPPQLDRRSAETMHPINPRTSRCGQGRSVVGWTLRKRQEPSSAWTIGGGRAVSGSGRARERLCNDSFEWESQCGGKRRRRWGDRDGGRRGRSRGRERGADNADGSTACRPAPPSAALGLDAHGGPGSPAVAGRGGVGRRRGRDELA